MKSCKKLQAEILLSKRVTILLRTNQILKNIYPLQSIKMVT